MAMVGGGRFRAGERVPSPTFPSLVLAACILPSGFLLQWPVN